MSMFDNIVFDEFTLLEGKQADEYKQRKTKEKNLNEKKLKDRVYRKTNDGIRNAHVEKDYTDAETMVKTNSYLDKSNKNYSSIDKAYAADAVGRYNRRHPVKHKKEWDE